MYIDVEAVKSIVKQAAALFSDRVAADHIYTKGVADFVTQVDFEVQRFMQQSLRELYPDIQFMGEEKSNEEIDKSGSVWILDPVDGTTNLIRDYKCSAISLALFENRKAVLGIVYDPYLDEMYEAQAGKGSYLNGKRITVSKVDSLEKSLVAIGTSPYNKELAEINFSLFQKVYVNCLDIRRSGSAAIDLAHVACGRVDCLLERNLKIWDYAAGNLLVREAGGVVWNYEGTDVGDENASDILAGNAVIPELIKTNILE